MGLAARLWSRIDRKEAVNPVGELAHQRLGATDLDVSELCLGTITFGAAIDEETAARVVGAFLDGGGNFLDTADVYAGGRAEEILGRVLGRRRDSVVVGTKVGMASEAEIARGYASKDGLRAAVHASLRRLGTDRIDLLHLHLPDRDTPIEETVVAADELVRAGAVRYVAVSNFTAWELARALAAADRAGVPRFAALQAQYSLVGRDVELELLPLCRAEGILPVVSWGSLGGGILSGKYGDSVLPAAGTRLAENPAGAHPLDRRTVPVVNAVRRIANEIGRTPAQVALRWVLGRSPVVSAVVGARSSAQVTDNLGIAGWTLTEEHARDLDRVGRPRLPYPHDLHRMLRV